MKASAFVSLILLNLWALYLLFAVEWNHDGESPGKMLVLLVVAIVDGVVIGPYFKSPEGAASRQAESQQSYEIMQQMTQQGQSSVGMSKTYRCSYGHSMTSDFIVTQCPFCEAPMFPL